MNFSCKFAAILIWDGDGFFLTMVWALNLYFHLLPPRDGFFPKDCLRGHDRIVLPPGFRSQS